MQLLSYLTLVPTAYSQFNSSVNKAVKESLQRNFQDWYSTQACNHMDSPVTQQVDLSISIVEPLGAVWLMKLILP